MLGNEGYTPMTFVSLLYLSNLYYPILDYIPNSKLLKEFVDAV